VLEKPLKRLEQIAVSSDGKKVAGITIAEKQFRVWDAATGKVLDDQALPEWKNQIMFAPLLKFSADGKLVYTVRDKQLFEITVGGKFRTLGEKLDFRELEEVAIDPEAKRFVVAKNAYGRPASELRVYDLVKEGEPQKVALTNHVRTLAFSPDGKMLAIGYLSPGKPRLELWDAATLKLRSTAKVEDRKDFESYRSVAFAADGKMLAAIPLYVKTTPKIIDVFDADGKLVREVPMQSLKATDIAFHPDGKTLAAHLTNHSVAFFDPATGEAKKP
jgi:WD40 repeat protein